MGLVVVLGESVRVQDYSFAGAVPIVAETPDEVRQQWAALEGDVSLVILTPSAAAALGDTVLVRARELLTVEMVS